MFGIRKSGEDGPVSEVSLTVSLRTYVRLALLVIITIILLSALHKAQHAILLIFVAFFLALALNAPVYWLSRQLPGKRRGSRSLATTLSFLIIIIALGGFIASVSPPLVRQTGNLVDAAPQLVKDLHSQNSAAGKLIRKYHLQKQVDTFSSQLSARLKNAGGAAFSTLQKVGSSFFSLLTILVLTFMMLWKGRAGSALPAMSFRTGTTGWLTGWLGTCTVLSKGSSTAR